MEPQTQKPSRGPQSQFQTGHEVPVQQMKKPGLQSQMEKPQPTSTQIPSEDQEEEEDAQETKRRVEEAGQKCYLLATDLRRKENCKKVVETALEKLGGIDILVNNAGTQTMLPDISDLDESQWESTFDTNIHPVFYLSKYTMPHLKSGSSIINCASVNPYIGRPDLLDYTSTKGAMVAFTRGLSNQQCSKGIRVNAVCPGPVWTPLIPATMTTEAIEQFSGTPMGRAGQPSEIATCFVFLASQDSSFISGQCLHPNGGVVLNG
ncbi:hypothetical protein AN3679.2 [Aspergillus nidulans FGSC A4]|nr:hypothetical protein AN3679.2 [Aspergillus nidulans FGSC A4]|eukprot:XP_661283.1 hypothetical protein AN3679.2 [Aspergillus nidulans FGSC A4]